MLFSEKENILMLFGWLGIRFTENQFLCLVRSNIFTENALHSQATQFSIHFLSCKHVENESIPHSLTKETKPSKKIHQIRSNWEKKEEREATGFDRWRRMRDRAAKARSSGVGVGLVRSTIWCDRRTGAIVGLVPSSIWCDCRSSFSFCLSLRVWSGNGETISMIGDWVRRGWVWMIGAVQSSCSDAIFLLWRRRSSCSFSLSLFYFPRPEVIWRENENISHFSLFWLYFSVNWKCFSVWPNLK